MINNINVQVFSSCNCDCSFCTFKDKCHNKINPKFVLKYLKDNPDLSYVVLTGGEPTLAIDVCSEIIKGLSDKTTVLQTNGWWGNNDIIKGIIKISPPSVMHISIDSEKQKRVNIENVKEAYNFSESLGIKTYIVNHTNDDTEYENNKKIFPKLKRGKILYDDGKLYDCGTALLATNKVGTLNIKGWGGDCNA